MTYSAWIGQMNCMPHTAPPVPGVTVPTGCIVFSGPSNAPLRKRNVVWMRPSGSFAYDSTAA